jgi:L-asparaginase II
MKQRNGLWVEVTRGDMVESRHSGSAVVVDAKGKIVRQWGDPDLPVYPRSAVKPLQALPLIETGAADRFGLTAKELALACASHRSEAEHVATAESALAKAGLSEHDLECGPQVPRDEAVATALVKADQPPRPIHNNCSGKHSGFLVTACHCGEHTKGYLGYEHPVQQRITRTLSELTGLDLYRAPRAIDGCGIPTIAIPLSALARAFARFAEPSGLYEDRRAAVSRIREAITEHPRMISGTGQFGTQIAQVTRGKVLVKSGAEGVYIAFVPQLGVGAAVKIDDGAGRASVVAIGAVLRQLGALSDAEAQALSHHLEAPVVNTLGQQVGVTRAVLGGA